MTYSAENKAVMKENYICYHCGRVSCLATALDKDGVIINWKYPRECAHCKKLSTYFITIFNLPYAIYGLLNRVRKLEKELRDAKR